MASSSQSAPTVPTVLASARKKSRRDDVTYQIITIAAMLLVLVTVWVF